METVPLPLTIAIGVVAFFVVTTTLAAVFTLWLGNVGILVGALGVPVAVGFALSGPGGAAVFGAGGVLVLVGLYLIGDPPEGEAQRTWRLPKARIVKR